MARNGLYNNSNHPLDEEMRHMSQSTLNHTFLI